MTPAPESSFIESGLTAAQDKLQHQVKGSMMDPLEWMQGIQSNLTVCGAAPASGGPMLGMLVERVFLVSGVVKTFFCSFKKKLRDFFVFYHEQKKVKQDFVVISKSSLFPMETLRICSITGSAKFQDSKGVFGGESEGVGVRSGSGKARTILLLHIISVSPHKQSLMVCTFLKVYMDLCSYFLFLKNK